MDILVDKHLYKYWSWIVVLQVPPFNQDRIIKNPKTQLSLYTHSTKKLQNHFFSSLLQEGLTTDYFPKLVSKSQ